MCRRSVCAPTRRRAIACCTLIAYLIAAHGALPSPVTLARWLQRASGQRFPCETCGCGCASADECWSNCCCHTEHERLVWAIREGVLPPASVTFSDAQWIAAANAVEAGSAHCSGCVAGILDKLRQCERTGTKGASPKPAASCCAPPIHDDESAASHTPASGPRVSPLRCKAVDSTLMATLIGVVLPDDPGVLRPAPIQTAVHALVQRPHSRAVAPPVPPPRRPNPA